MSYSTSSAFFSTSSTPESYSAFSLLIPTQRFQNPRETHETYEQAFMALRPSNAANQQQKRDSSLSKSSLKKFWKGF
ncbi:hypothetical protein Moror_7458 [Moniliophthora roreri MCA 2997]|uniref:Uncharacterized protein n=1 Tax=Moniliophthora roreri (strain MCA 2997) TaxID=1381753 RepID=V2XAC8_MONRO|nr:hypothetical protein Moror_7458 [Moniliophthora roreri MCA 2997]